LNNSITATSVVSCGNYFTLFYNKLAWGCRDLVWMETVETWCFYWPHVRSVTHSTV